jgi:transcriptional regulator with XRE-family HTH domain
MALGSLGARARYARKLSGLSSRGLSLRAGLDANTLSQIERERRRDPQVSSVAALAVTLGLSLDWLVLGRGAAPDAIAIASALHRARSAAR